MTGDTTEKRNKEMRVMSLVRVTSVFVLFSFFKSTNQSYITHT